MTQPETDITQHPPATLYLSGEGFRPIPGTRFELADTGLAAASDGAMTLRHIRATSRGEVALDLHWHDSDLQYVHILCGEIEFDFGPQGRHTLIAGDGVHQPAGCVHAVTYVSDDLELLEIYAPAVFNTLRERDQ